MFKIKFNSHLGSGLYFVVEASSSTEAKQKFYDLMLGTDTMKSWPQKTTKTFIKGVKKIGGTHWVVLP